MKTSRIWLIHIIIMSIYPVWTAFPPSLRHPIPIVANKVSNIKFSCDTENLNITLKMQSPFKGLIFARDFAQECKATGNFDTTLKISLPTSGCGVRLGSFPDSEGTIQMVYTINLVVQQDRFLRQISDQEKIVHCQLKDDAFLVKSKALVKTLKDELKEGQINHRVGRMKDAGWSKELEGKQLEEELHAALAASRAWMEILPGKYEDTLSSGRLQVGETALLTVKSTLPAGVGWKIVDCLAHDGLGDSSQKLINEIGCPIDELLMPTPIYGPIRPIALMRHQEAFTRFPAFKFPDRDRLHFSCGLQLCKGPCSKVDCHAFNDIENRTAKSLIPEDYFDDEILDRIEVFNSVEVFAPEIDDFQQTNRLQLSEPATFPFTNIPGDRTFCVSPDKMAVAFCILGLIFLIAIIVAAYSLLRSRRDSGHPSSYYTRSLFSSSSSGGSGFGSKLLLRDSPSLAASTSRGLQYGRIL